MGKTGKCSLRQGKVRRISDDGVCVSKQGGNISVVLILGDTELPTPTLRVLPCPDPAQPRMHLQSRADPVSPENGILPLLLWYSLLDVSDN